MPHPPLTIYCNAKFPEPVLARFRAALNDHRLLLASAANASNLDPGKEDPLLEQADAVLGQPDPDQLIRLPNVKWVQLTTAGYTRYDTKRFRDAMTARGTIVTNASSIYAEPCAQHILAMMLAQARKLPEALDNQRIDHAWPYLSIRTRSNLLNGQTALIVGYGAIGRRLAQLLAPFDMNLIGFRRRPDASNEPIRIEPVDRLDEFLPQADHVVNVLPASNATEEFFNADRLGMMNRGAVYYNIGRGSTTDQYALQSVLQTNYIAAAYIDATEPEPLPNEHPLWTTPNCFITPHTAGGHSTEFERHVEFFLANLARFEKGESLVDRII
jgi:phosphoglycerate dehydrogenase-like enzyme